MPGTTTHLGDQAPIVATKISYIASLVTAIFGTLTLQEVAAIIGICFAALTFTLSVYFNSRRDKREAAIALLQQKELVSRIESLHRKHEEVVKKTK